eukprot:5067745-Amphidinium_carterae.1
MSDIPVCRDVEEQQMIVNHGDFKAERCGEFWRAGYMSASAIDLAGESRWFLSERKGRKRG